MNTHTLLLSAVLSIWATDACSAAPSPLYLSVTSELKSKLQKQQKTSKAFSSNDIDLYSFIRAQRRLEQGLPEADPFRFTIRHPDIIRRAVEHQDIEMLTLLLQLGENKSTLIREIGMAKSAPLIENLLDKGMIEVQECPKEILFQAMDDGSLSFFAKMLEAGSDPNALREGRYSLLSYAVRQKKRPFVERLLRHSADVNTPHNKYAPLMCAIEARDTAMVSALIQAGAELREKGDYNPLLQAVSSGNLEMVRLLADSGTPIQAADHNLLTIAQKAGHADIVEYLLAHSVKVNTKHDECPELIQAIKAKDSTLVATLIRAGAELREKGKYNPLLEAICYGNVEIVRLLAEAGAPLRQTDYNLLLVALKTEHADIAEYLLDHGAEEELYVPNSRVAAYVMTTKKYPARMEALLSKLRKKITDHEVAEIKRLEDEQRQDELRKQERLKQEEKKKTKEAQKAIQQSRALRKQVFNKLEYLSAARPTQSAKYYIFLHIRPSYSAGDRMVYIHRRLETKGFYEELKQQGFELILIYYENDKERLSRYAVQQQSIPAVTADSLRLATLPMPEKIKGQYRDDEQFWEKATVLDSNFNLIPDCCNIEWGLFVGYYDAEKRHSPYCNPFQSH